MKNFINKTLILLAVTLVFGACTKDENFTIADPSAVVEVVASKTSIELSKDLIGQDAITVSWSEPDYNFASEAPTYEVHFALADMEASLVATTTEFTKTFEVEEFNKALLAAGFEPTIENELIITVTSKIGALKTTSEGFIVNVTPYADKLDLSTAWGIVGSAAPNGWDGPDAPFYKTSDASIYVAYVTLATGEFKIRKDNDWTVNYGDDGVDGSLDAGGANIPVEAGTYKVSFNQSELTYTVESYTWGLVGHATENGWDGPDMPLTYDATTDTWKAAVTLLDGEFKVRLNNAWDFNFGDTGVDGTLDAGGDNIAVEAGYYLITVNFNDNTYTLESTDFWGIVGSAAPNGWDGPNVKLIQDISKPGIFYYNGIEFIDGEIKFRSNDSWDVNYGDDGADGTLESGSANIAVTAGTYNVVLDLTDESAPTYTLVKL